ncbi:MAG: hypothetical protein KKB31_08060 [Nanoarchaeota archaeon]|nr:hypothetical protein [Nanoarchaeota archaeon]
MWFKRKQKVRECIPEIRKELDDARYVSYRKDGAKGRELHIVGSKYPMKGNPNPIGLKAIGPLKSLFDKILQSRISAIIPHEINQDKLTPICKELARVFDLLIEAESLYGMKQRWLNYKRVMIFFLENDLAYRYRMQWMLQRMNLKKIALDDGDKYYFRAKNFRVDLEDEWKETLKKYPKLDVEAFKKYIWPGDVPEEVSRSKVPMIKLAEEFIKL